MRVSLGPAIESAIREITGDGIKQLHEPIFLGNENKYVSECINSGQVSAIGTYISSFEKSVAQYVGVKNAVSVVNGTAALHLALLVAGVTRNDEVLIPALTFVATANAVSYCGATPHLIDVDFISLGIDPKKLRKYLNKISFNRGNKCINKTNGKVIKALIPMHTFGHPSEMQEIVQIAEDFNLILIEDAAESLGSFLDNRHTGTFGRFGVLSFNGNKIITTGGGGMVLTDDDEMAHKVRHLSTTAKIPHDWKYDHDIIGFNYRMPNVNAAIGLAQFEKIEEKIINKRKLFFDYKRAFSNIHGVTLFEEPAKARSNYWLQTLLLDNQFAEQKDSIIKYLIDKGLKVRSTWNLISDLNSYKNVPSDSLEVSMNLSKRIINIPSSPQLLVS